MITSVTAIVDYDRSIADLIANGQYFNASSYISEENFPRKENERGKKQVTFRTFWFDRDIELEEVLRKMKEDQFRPASVRELLLFREVVGAEFFKQSITSLEVVNIGTCASPRVVDIWNDYQDFLVIILCTVHKWFRTCHFLGIQE